MTENKRALLHLVIGDMIEESINELNGPSVLNDGVDLDQYHALRLIFDLASLINKGIIGEKDKPDFIARLKKLEESCSDIVAKNVLNATATNLLNDKPE